LAEQLPQLLLLIVIIITTLNQVLLVHLHPTALHLTVLLLLLLFQALNVLLLLLLLKALNVLLLVLRNYPLRLLLLLQLALNTTH
jgi:hypothetical protein